VKQFSIGEAQLTLKTKAPTSFRTT